MESLNQAIEDIRSRYASLNPQSQAADKSAEKYFPGGNTETVPGLRTSMTITTSILWVSFLLACSVIRMRSSSRPYKWR